jgi:hypothetical protein
MIALFGRFSSRPMESLLAPAFLDRSQNYWKSTLQRELSDYVIVLIVK